MLRLILKISALSTLVLGFCGCPLLNQFLESPEGAFEASPTTGEAPLTVLFVDASVAGTANVDVWQWDFGDGKSSNSRNPSHIYENPGVYTVSLTVTTSVGTNTALRRDYINVVEAPTAEFSAAPVLGNSPLTVIFTDLSDPGSSEIIDWQWNFGDRTPTSAEQNPTHIYDEPGLYTVSLTVSTAVDSDTMTKTQYVNVAGSPTADFNADFEPGTAPLTVEFTDTSDAGTAAITGWAWDFGDGEMSADQNPTHTYVLPGDYTVTLSIETEVGDDTVVREKLIRVAEGPVAAFSGDPVMGPAPLSVAFSDESSAGSDAITKWLWDFGDGGLLSTRQTPTRVYNVPGIYTVSLKVTTPVGSNTLEQEDYITVLPGVVFTANKTNGIGSLTTQFIDQSPTGDFEISAWAWDFGDGMMSDLANPEHTYAEPGEFDVTLTITTELGDSMTTEIGYISVAPETAFSADPVSGSPPLDVSFTDETVAGNFEIGAWAWDFGDGGSSDEASPMHRYTTPGIYTVSLDTTTENGTDSEVKGGLIKVSPIVGIGASSTAGQGTLSVNFTDQTDAGNLNILGWFWDFGDGMSSTSKNPSHTYANIGTYTVSLRVTTALGDTTKTEMDFIKVGPAVNFSNDGVEGVGTLSVKFTDLTDAGSLEIVGWMWAFGDGAVSDEQHPTHEFTPGQYDVSLTVTTSQGDTTHTKTDLILVAPLVDIDFVQSTGPAPFEASLLDVTMPGNFEITAWDWNLGDGSSSTERNPVHTYVEPGKYTVTLTISTDGGSFFVTEKDFITAQRGPTAIFSQIVTPGGDEEDPVTVSFLNMSLAGDAPILNQTWDFGMSAIFAEEDAEELNPTVIYPGLAFNTIPQDVSLTVRTFIAADTLLKENLYNAPGAKRSLSAEALLDSELQLLSTNGSGDLWAAGLAFTVPGEPADIVIARLDKDGHQRWGISLASKTPVSLAGACVAEDGTLILVGSLETSNRSAVYLSCFDGAGTQLWDRLVYGNEGLYGAGITSDGKGGFVATCHADASKGLATLYLLTGDLSGDAIELLETNHRLSPGAIPLVAIGEDRLLLADGMNGIIRAALGASKATIGLESAVTSGETLSLNWDAGQASLQRSLVYNGDVLLEIGDTLEAAPLDLRASTPHCFRTSSVPSESGLVWLVRDSEAQKWVVKELAPAAEQE